ncbi:MAG: ThiF family adenylyltransferase [Candidatus Methylomirabilales bacterium]
MLEIKVIGIGGIGCALLPFLARYLNFQGERARVTLIDGDDFERRNAERQAFGALGNKAKVKATEVAREFEGLSFRAVPEYITEANIAQSIQDGDIIFLAVDNHNTRKLVSDHCEKLVDVTLISGGNDFTDGNVQIYARRGGRDQTAPVTRFHPEIQDPTDRSPAEMSCEELMESGAPQLLFTNLAVASGMLNAFYSIREGRLQYGEVYLDIIEGKSNPVKREGERAQ